MYNSDSHWETQVSEEKEDDHKRLDEELEEIDLRNIAEETKRNEERNKDLNFKDYQAKLILTLVVQTIE